MSQKNKHKMPRQALILTAALIVVAILLVIAFTRAWLFQEKGLQTMTKIQFPYLYLKGQTTDTISVELGEIDLREDGEKRIPFRVVAGEDSYFKLQIGHTTNLPLSYKIIKAADDWKDWETVEVITDNTVNGKYLNNNNGIANEEEHGVTYGTYSSEYVQKNAEPLYWQSDSIKREKEEHNYILIVSWKKCDDTVIDKDTDMIYLTAGIVEQAS